MKTGRRTGVSGLRAGACPSPGPAAPSSAVLWLQGPRSGAPTLWAPGSAGPGTLHLRQALPWGGGVPVPLDSDVGISLQDTSLLENEDPRQKAQADNSHGRIFTQDPNRGHRAPLR